MARACRVHTEKKFSWFFAGEDQEDHLTVYTAGSHWPPKRFQRYLIDHFGIL